MSCVFTNLTEPVRVQASDETELQNAINSAGSTVTQVDINNNIALTQPIDVPSGSRIILYGATPGTSIDSAVPYTFQLFRIHSSVTSVTIFHIAGLELSGGGGNINGGAIGANEPGTVEVVVERGSSITSCQVPNGGGIYVLEGAVKIDNSGMSHCHASVDGGAIHAPCVYLNLSDVSRNLAARNGGSIYTLDFTQMSSQVSENDAGGDGGGVYLVGPGLIEGDPDDPSGLSFNTAGGNGGAIYLSNAGAITDLLVLDRGVRVDDDKAQLDGGGIWVAHSQLSRVMTNGQINFGNNMAQNSVPNRLAIDDAVYLANIHSNTWTSPFTQGYNNYDIAYAPPIPCTVVGERLLDIALPVMVRPFATVGDVVSRCCGTATIVPEYQDFPPDEPNCDFTIHQRVCVQVPVEFGATVEPGRVHSECTGESCENCDELDENV